MRDALRTVGIIALFNVMVLFAVLAIHEAGHYFMGMYAGCDSGKAVLFDSGVDGPYTELKCTDEINHFLPYSGSLVFTLGFGSLFLFFRDAPERNLFFIVVGLSILTAGLDLVMLTNVDFLYYVSLFVGVGLVVFGEVVFGLSFVGKD